MRGLISLGFVKQSTESKKWQKNNLVSEVITHLLGLLSVYFGANNRILSG